MVGVEVEVMLPDTQSPPQSVMTLAKTLHSLQNLLRPDGIGCVRVVYSQRPHNLKSQISDSKKLLGRME